MEWRDGIHCPRGITPGREGNHATLIGQSALNEQSPLSNVELEWEIVDCIHTLSPSHPMTYLEPCHEVLGPSTDEVYGRHVSSPELDILRRGEGTIGLRIVVEHEFTSLAGNIVGYKYAWTTLTLKCTSTLYSFVSTPCPNLAHTLQELKNLSPNSGATQ